MKLIPIIFEAYNEWGDILIKIEKKNFLYFFFKKNFLKKLENHKEAIEKYKKANKINPLYFNDYFNLANALYYLGQKEKAI